MGMEWRVLGISMLFSIIGLLLSDGAALSPPQAVFGQLLVAD